MPILTDDVETSFDVDSPSDSFDKDQESLKKDSHPSDAVFVPKTSISADATVPHPFRHLKKPVFCKSTFEIDNINNK